MKKVFLYYEKHRSNIHNFVWRTLQVFGKQGVTFLIFILSAKFLTPHDFGIYNYVLTIILFLIMFGDFGISTATSKHVAEYNETDQEKLRAILFNAGLLIAGLTAIVSVAVLIIGPWYLKDKYVYVLYLLPLVFLTPMTSLYDGIYRGLKKFKQLATISLSTGFIALFFVYFLVKSYGLIGALVAQNIFYIILLLGLGIGYKDFHFRLNRQVIREIGKYSLLVGIADLGIFLYIQFDVLVLGWFNYINEIAYLSIANKIFMTLALPFAILGQVIAPDITSAYVHKRYQHIKEKLKKYFLGSFLAGLVIATIVFVCMRPVTVYFLSQYNNNLFYLFFTLLLVIFPIRVFGSVLASGFIIAAGQAKVMTYNNLIFGILNVVMDIIFIATFGAVGVIFSTLILGYISVFVAYYYFNKHMSNEN